MEDLYKKAKQSALRLLAFRAQSIAEMQQKLTRQGYEPRTVLSVINEMRNAGHLNDDRFAQEFIRYQLLRRPTGRFLLQAKLKEHGISDEIASRSLAREFPPERECELALELALAKKKELRIQLSQLSSLQKKKIGQYLSSRGFASDLVWETIDKLDKGEREW